VIKAFLALKIAKFQPFQVSKFETIDSENLGIFELVLQIKFKISNNTKTLFYLHFDNFSSNLKIKTNFALV